jgi:hypothetical protein
VGEWKSGTPTGELPNNGIEGLGMFIVARGRAGRKSMLLVGGSCFLNDEFGSVFRRNRVGVSTSSTLGFFIAVFLISARSSPVPIAGDRECGSCRFISSRADIPSKSRLSR